MLCECVLGESAGIVACLSMFAERVCWEDVPLDLPDVPVSATGEEESGEKKMCGCRAT